MGRWSESTQKKGVISDYYETTVRDKETGTLGSGIDSDKGKSISKAYEDVREKTCNGTSSGSGGK